MKADIIVSRHPGAVAWLRDAYPELADVPVVAAVSAADVQGKVVVGNLPMHLASAAECVYAIEFSGPAPRGAEYSAAEMREAGARTTRYYVLDPREIAWGDLDAALTSRHISRHRGRWRHCVTSVEPCCKG